MRVLLLHLLLIGLCFASIKSGQATLSTNEDIAIVLSTGQIYTAEEDVEFQKTDILIEPWERPAWCANYLRIQGNFSTISSVPSSGGYFDEVNKGPGCSYVEEGLYALKTRDGKYAVVEVLDASQRGFSDKYINTITFRYKLQTDGSTNVLASGSNEEKAKCLGSILTALSALFLASIRKLI